MATYYGSNATKYLNSSAGVRTLIDQGESNGRVKVSYDTYSAAALNTGDIIKMPLIPQGARILDVILKWDALGAGTLDVGWEDNGTDGASSAGFISAQAVTSSGCTSLTKIGSNVGGLFKEFSLPTQIDVTCHLSTSTPGNISLAVEYIID